jgi:pyrroloquinoline quinone (PQQ) biosynthesis protein C
MLKVTQHPPWVDTFDEALDPLQCEILDLPVVVQASENTLDASAIRNFCVEFYPIIRDFPYWLEVLLKRSPPEGEPFFRENIRVERRHGAMWRAMGDGFGVPPECFEGYIPSNPTVNAFHNFLTDIGANGPFASAVAATNYAVEGVAQKIATKALLGLQYNDRLGGRGRWWLEEHAKYDDEHPIVAMELIKSCMKNGNGEMHHLQASALRSLELLGEAMDDSYHG